MLIEQVASVERIDATSVTLQTTAPSSGCHQCTSQPNCSTSLVSQLLARHLPGRLQLPANLMPASIQAGDQVLLSINQSDLYRATLLLYALPLLSLLVGALSGAWLGTLLGGANTAEPGSILIGLLGLGIGLMYARRQSLSYSKRLEHNLQVTKTVQVAAVPVAQVQTTS